MTFSYKVHKSENETVLAIADSNLVGKDFSVGGRTVKISHAFYGDEHADAKEILTIVGSATIVNAIGSKITALLVKHDVVKKTDVVQICGLPHAQIF